jgi:polar amino acid transport system substrate-binding protein
LHRLVRALFWLAICMAGGAAHAERVTVYTNASVAPLVINARAGLFPELVAYLNQLKPGGLEFTLVHVPRRRLQMALDDGKLDGIVIGLTPEWVGDVAQHKFLWTEPFSQDALVLVSHASHPVRFGQPAAPGTRIGLTLGYVYPAVDEWIARDALVRDDAPTEQLNLDKLALGRVEMAVVTGSVFRYYLRTHPKAGGAASETLPGKPTERRFLVPASRRDLYDKLAPAIHQLHDDPAWQRIQAQY